MTESNRRGLLWSILRPTPRRFVVLIVLGAMMFFYKNYFTPEKRAVRHRLSEADTKSEAAIDARLKPLTALFAKGRKGAKAFAKEALSWDSKWEYVKGMVGGSESHRRYLAEAFAHDVFSPEDLRAAMESVVKAYLDDVEGYESEMLVKLRADLANIDRPNEVLPKQLRSNEEFRREYQKLSGVVVKELRSDVGVTVGRELGILIASDVAAQAALQAVKAAATEMGVSAGVLGTGAASTIATLGVGMVVAIILDYILDEVFKLAGYDPEAKIEGLVCDSIDKLEASLIHEGGFFSRHKKGTLRVAMEELHEARSKTRRETIAKLMKEGGMQ